MLVSRRVVLFVASALLAIGFSARTGAQPVLIGPALTNSSGSSSPVVPGPVAPALTDVRAQNAEQLRLAQRKLETNGETDKVAAREVAYLQTRDAILAQRAAVEQQIKDLNSRKARIEAQLKSPPVSDKAPTFADLDRITKPEAVLATNTSSLSVTEISVATMHPRRVVGLHFFNPAPVLGFVEVVRTLVTDAEVVEAVTAFTQGLGMTPVVCGDKGGFITNALLCGYLNHAVTMFESHYATREDIDAAMMYGCGYPMGPLALLDLIGLDIAYEILNTMYRQGRRRVHAPAPILKQMITAGLRGRKDGRGFYTYVEKGSSVVVPDELTPSQAARPVLRREVGKVGVIGTGTMATVTNYNVSAGQRYYRVQTQ